MPLITAVRLSKIYRAGRRRSRGRDVSFAIEKGSFVAFVGPSGSGKSTLLNMISTEQRSTRPSSLAAIWMATLTDSSWASSSRT